MSSKESFFSRNRDLLNAAGHTINAIQNYKVRDNQKKLAKLSLLSLSIQKENAKHSKAQVELLKEKQAEKKKQNKIKRHQKHIINLMYKTAPELEGLTNSINKITDEKKFISAYLDARYMLKFLELNRDLIEEIDFHRLIRQQQIELNQIKNKIKTDSHVLKDNVFKNIKNEQSFLEGVKLFLNEKKDVTSDELNIAKEVFVDFHNDPVRVAIFAESIEIALDNNFEMFDKTFGTEVIKTIENINDWEYFNSNLIESLKEKSYLYVISGVNDLIDDQIKCNTIAETIRCLKEFAIVSLYEITVIDISSGRVENSIKARDFLELHR